jgi:hypothetical protein
MTLPCLLMLAQETCLPVVYQYTKLPNYSTTNVTQE